MEISNWTKIILLSFFFVPFATATGVVVESSSYDIDDSMGKSLLQLIDDDLQPISGDNATCYVQSYNPNGSLWSAYSLMNYVDEGIFEYNFEIPNQTGVYSQVMKCDIPRSVDKSYSDDFECGTLSCNPDEWNAGWSGTCDISSIEGPRESNHLNCERGESSFRSVDLSAETGDVFLTFWAKANNLNQGADQCTYDYYDGATYNNLLTLEDADSDNQYAFYSFEVGNTYGVSTDSRIRVSAAGVGPAGEECYIDDISISVQAILVNFTEYQGMTEVRVRGTFSGLFDLLNQILSILGIVESNDISEIGAFNSVTVDISDISGFVGQEKGVSVLASTDTLAINTATCTLDAYSPTGIHWLVNETLTPLGTQGIHLTNVTLPEYIGTNRAVATCSQGILNQTTIRGTTSWRVEDGARMVSIT